MSIHQNLDRLYEKLSKLQNRFLCLLCKLDQYEAHVTAIKFKIECLQVACVYTFRVHYNSDPVYWVRDYNYSR